MIYVYCAILAVYLVLFLLSMSENSGPHFPKTTGTAKENGSREERLEAGALRQAAW